MGRFPSIDSVDGKGVIGYPRPRLCSLARPILPRYLDHHLAIDPTIINTISFYSHIGIDTMSSSSSRRAVGRLAALVGRSMDGGRTCLRNSVTDGLSSSGVSGSSGVGGALGGRLYFGGRQGVWRYVVRWWTMWMES